MNVGNLFFAKRDCSRDLTMSRLARRQNRRLVLLRHRRLFGDAVNWHGKACCYFARVEKEKAV